MDVTEHEVSSSSASMFSVEHGLDPESNSKSRSSMNVGDSNITGVSATRFEALLRRLREEPRIVPRPTPPVSSSMTIVAPTSLDSSREAPFSPMDNIPQPIDGAPTAEIDEVRSLRDAHSPLRFPETCEPPLSHRRSRLLLITATHPNAYLCCSHRSQRRPRSPNATSHDMKTMLFWKYVHC